MSREKLFEHWMQQPDNECDFDMSRGVYNLSPEEATLTFSEVFLGTYLDNVQMFIGTRMMRHFEATGKPPRRMIVSVKVQTY